MIELFRLRSLYQFVGELRNVAAQMCIDTQFHDEDGHFGLRKCDENDGEQNLRLTFWKDIRPNQRAVCFDVSTAEQRAPVLLIGWYVIMKFNQ